MSGALPVGRVLGIPLWLHWSWFLTLALVTAVLAVRYFPGRLPEASRPELWLYGLMAALGFFGSVLLHEVSHTVTARRFGLAVTGITLHAFGGLAHLEREPDSPRVDFLAALVGPLTSFVIATVCWGAQAAGTAAPGPRAMLAYLAAVNWAVGIFNLVPGLPLDGGRLLRAVLWRWRGNRARATWRASQLGAVFGSIVAASGALSLVGGELIGGAWLILVGLLLALAARADFPPGAGRHALERVRVGAVMISDVEAVPPSATLDRLVMEYLSPSPIASCPVVASGDGVVGIVTVRQVIAVPRDRWPATPVGRVMIALRPDLTIAPSASCWDALRKLLGNGVGSLVVLEGNRLVGSLDVSDLAPLLALSTRGPRSARARRATNSSPPVDCSVTS